MATDTEVLPIWREVAQALTKGASFSILNQYLWAGREVCRRQFFGAADMMHVCNALFMFVHNTRRSSDLSILNQYLWAGREVCRRQFFGATYAVEFCTRDRKSVV